MPDTYRRQAAVPFPSISPPTCSRQWHVQQNIGKGRRARCSVGGPGDPTAWGAMGWARWVGGGSSATRCAACASRLSLPQHQHKTGTVPRNSLCCNVPHVDTGLGIPRQAMCRHDYACEHTLRPCKILQSCPFLGTARTPRGPSLSPCFCLVLRAGYVLAGGRALTGGVGFVLRCEGGVGCLLAGGWFAGWQTVGVLANSQGQGKGLRPSLSPFRDLRSSRLSLFPA